MILDLPVDILVLILSYLELKHAIRLRLVCKKFKIVFDLEKHWYVRVEKYLDKGHTINIKHETWRQTFFALGPIVQPLELIKRLPESMNMQYYYTTVVLGKMDDVFSNSYVSRDSLSPLLTAFKIYKNEIYVPLFTNNKRMLGVFSLNGDFLRLFDSGQSIINTSIQDVELDIVNDYIYHSRTLNGYRIFKKSALNFRMIRTETLYIDISHLYVSKYSNFVWTLQESSHFVIFDKELDNNCFHEFGFGRTPDRITSFCLSDDEKLLYLAVLLNGITRIQIFEVTDGQIGDKAIDTIFTDFDNIKRMTSWQNNIYIMTQHEIYTIPATNPPYTMITKKNKFLYRDIKSEFISFQPYDDSLFLLTDKDFLRLTFNI